MLEVESQRKVLRFRRGNYADLQRILETGTNQELDLVAAVDRPAASSLRIDPRSGKIDRHRQKDMGRAHRTASALEQARPCWPAEWVQVVAAEELAVHTDCLLEQQVGSIVGIQDWALDHLG